MVQENYTPSGWLGLLTAGILWTPMSDEASAKEGIDGLTRQIMLALSPNPESDDFELQMSGSPDFSVSDLRGELDRLKKENDTYSIQPDSRAMMPKEDERAQAMIPADVPELPLGVFVTQPMKELLSRLVDGEAHRIGFLVNNKAPQNRHPSGLWLPGVAQAFGLFANTLVAGHGWDR